MSIQKTIRSALLAGIVFASSTASAGYSGNFVSKVTWVANYRGGYICVGFETPPTGCGTYLCTSGDSESSTSRMFGRYLAAYKTGETVNTGYDLAACSFAGLIYRAG